MKVYVASSWRNQMQPAVVQFLREQGHDVYDFRNPPGRAGFGWEEIDGGWTNWTPDQYRQALQHPSAIAGYDSDVGALRDCEACLLVLPSGRSASWELGFATALGKRVAVLQFGKFEPELMYREAKILTSWIDLEEWARPPKSQLPDADRCPVWLGSAVRCERELGHRGNHRVVMDPRNTFSWPNDEETPL